MAPDYKVYNFFKDKFRRQVEAFGKSKMTKELHELSKANEYISEKCGFSTASNKEVAGPNKWWGDTDLLAYKVKDNIMLFHISINFSPLR